MTRKEYNQCVDQYADSVYGFALKNLRNEDDAKDIVQEAFAKLWVKREDVDGKKSKSYLFSIAYHSIIDHVRKVKRMNEHNLGVERIEDMASQIENKQWIEEGLNKLTEQERSLVLLRDYEGYKYDELAEMTGLSLSQVKVYLFRARKKFRDWLIDIDKVNQII